MGGVALNLSLGEREVPATGLGERDRAHAATLSEPPRTHRGRHTHPRSRVLGRNARGDFPPELSRDAAPKSSALPARPSPIAPSTPSTFPPDVPSLRARAGDRRARGTEGAAVGQLARVQSAALRQDRVSGDLPGLQRDHADQRAAGQANHAGQERTLPPAAILFGVAEQVGFVDDDNGQPGAFVEFPGEQPGNAEALVGSGTALI